MSVSHSKPKPDQQTEADELRAALRHERARSTELQYRAAALEEALRRSYHFQLALRRERED